MADFLGDSVKSLSQTGVGLVGAVVDKTPKEFDSFQDVTKMFEGGIRLPQSQIINQLRESVPSEFLKTVFRSDGAPILKFPMPDLIKGKTLAYI